MSYACNECQQADQNRSAEIAAARASLLGDPLSRRSFLVRSGSAFAALCCADPILKLVSSTYGATLKGTGNLLVLCQLNGGLDALSFLAPFTNSVYQSRRPQLKLGAADVDQLSNWPDYGINKQFQFFSELFQQNQVAIVQQVAYPDGNGSHFESQEIYEYGVRNLGASQAANIKWYERLRSTYFNEPYGVLDTRKIGDPRVYGYPDQTYHKAAQEAFGRLARLKTPATAAQQSVIGAYNKIDQIGAQIRQKTQNFQSTGSARGEFFRAAMLAYAGLGTQIIKLEYGGFDTHGNQAEANAQLFPSLDSQFRQFVDDLKAIGVWDRTCVVFYSEFGRRNDENGSPGTDHGHGGHMILCGPRVNPGLFGQLVTTSDLNERDLPFYVDFRAVFSVAIRDWLGFDPAPIFSLEGESFDMNTGGPLFV